MRIDFQYLPEPAQTDRSQSHNVASNNGSLSKVQSGTGEDQAQLSGAHAQVAALAGLASQFPEIREERVQALRQAIQTGQYPLDAEKTAGAMLAEMTSTSAPAA